MQHPSDSCIRASFDRGLLREKQFLRRGANCVFGEEPTEEISLILMLGLLAEAVFMFEHSF